MTTLQTAEDDQSVNIAKLIFWSILLYIAWHWTAMGPVLLEGKLPGPDDFLRFHRIDAWLDGQGWFDATVPRMIGSDIHWSRLVDLPIAVITLILGIAVDQTTALRLSALLWPIILFVSTILVVARMCDPIAGKHSRLLALLFAGLNTFAMTEFAPGRIDHHNVQILLLLVALAGLFAGSSWATALAVGISVPLSVAVGLEILVLFAVVLAGLAVSWVINGDADKPVITRTGLVMAAATLAFYAATVPAAEWLIAHCDAYSLLYLHALLGTSLGFILLGQVAGILSIGGTSTREILFRLILGGGVGGLLIVSLAMSYPQCLGGPMAGITNELNVRWLMNVTEARGLIETASDQAERWISGVAYLVLLLLISLVMAWKRGREFPHLVTLAAVLWVCALVALIQVRVLRTGILAAVPICVVFAAMVIRWIEVRFPEPKALATALQVVVCVSLTSWTWALLAMPFANISGPVAGAEHPSAQQEQAESSTPPLTLQYCYTVSGMRDLKNLPDGLVMSDLNIATAILAHTDLHVVSGPYHRNGEAILAVLDFFESDEDDARKVIDRLGAQYVVTCIPDEDLSAATIETMNGRIWKNALPDWLEWVSQPDAKLAVLKISD